MQLLFKRDDDQTRTFQDALTQIQQALRPVLEKLLVTYPGPDALGRAMGAAVLDGGKRLRPFFHLAACEALGVGDPASLEVAAVLELIHCYSLVHDDLPCMDDATLRRGAPTIHVRFGQSTALLAGNALLTLAFEALANLDAPSQKRCALVKTLARASGPQGMMAGQYFDLNPDPTPTLDDITRMQRLKTGALIEACFGCALILADETADHPLHTFGQEIGLAFQILDDLKDLLACADAVGKDVGHDGDKATFVSLLGPEGAAHEMTQCLVRARNCLQGTRSDLALQQVVEALHKDLQDLLEKGASSLARLAHPL